MTVNELMQALRKAQRAGRGQQSVFIYYKGSKFCPEADEVHLIHTPKMGHVVVFSHDSDGLTSQSPEGATAEA